MIFSTQRPILVSHARRRGATAAPAKSPRAWLPRIFIACLAALLLASAPWIGPHFPIGRGLFLTTLALIAEAFPVTGPRGRRIGLADGVGLASLLLLPPPLAPLPSLLAGGLCGLAGQSRTSQRQTLAKALGRGAAALLGSIARGHAGIWAALAIYALLRAATRSWHLSARRRDLGMEMAALAASAPAALLMAHLWPEYGLAGATVATALLGLLLLVGHFGFETGLLREQVQAMERLGAVTLARDNLPRLIERFLQLGGTLTSSHRMVLWLADDTKICLERVACAEARWMTADEQRPQSLGAGPAAVRYGEGLVGRVADRQVPLLVQDVTRDQRAVEAERQEWPQTPRSLLLLPLIIAGETLGVVQFERDDPQPYTARDLSRVRALANQAAAAISNAQRHRAVTNQAVTDGLTGLFNRRHIQAALESEERRVQRYGHTLSLIMLDVDHFKSYNDTYGHTQGDVLIKAVAALLRANVRAVDIVGRYGGEEFIILMPETDKEEAQSTAERLRRAMAEATFPGFADDPEMVVLKTISLGVATMPEDAADTDMLVTRADQALYEAKRAGRNRVMTAWTPIVAA